MDDVQRISAEALPAAALRTVLAQLTERDLCSARLACKQLYEASAAAVTSLTPRAPLRDVLQKFNPVQLQLLDLKYTRLDAAQLACFAQLTALRQLDLSYIPCADAVRASLVYKLAASCRDLTSLEITSVTDLIAEQIARITQLDTLSVSGRITNRGLEQLSSLQRLQHLSLSCCDAISDHGLQMLTTLTALVDLQLHSCLHLSDPALQLIGQLTQLTSLCLSLSCEDATSAGILHLSLLTNLKQLHFSAAPEGAAPSALAQVIASLSQLTWMDLSYTESVDPSVLRAVAGLQKLQVLSLSGLSLRSVPSLKYLKRLPHLHHLQLRWTGQLQDSHLSFLPHLATLSALDLSYCRCITTEGLQRLVWLTQLKQLNLMSVPSDELSCLSALQQLTGLTVSLLPYSCKGWQHIAGLSQLRSLALRRCMISASNSSKSASCSSNTPSSSNSSSSTTTSDPSSSNSNSPESTPAPSSSFINLSQLQKLTALDCNGSTVQAAAIAILQRLPHLEHLSLGRCQNVSSTVLALLTGCSSLRKLDLRLRGPGSTWGLKGLQLLLDKLPGLSAVLVNEVPNELQQRNVYRVLACPWERVALPVTRDVGCSMSHMSAPRLW